MNSKKVLVGTILMGVLGMVLTGCGNKGTKEKGTSEFEPMVQLSYEAEQMTLQGNVKIVSDPRMDGFSGETYVDGFEDNGDACEFEVEIPEDGFYDLDFVSASCGGEKTNQILVDGEVAGTVKTEEETFTDAVLKRIYMSKGRHTVALHKEWGWILLDRLVITDSELLDQSIYEIDTPLCNPEASDEARAYTVICVIFTERRSCPDRPAIRDLTERKFRRLRKRQESFRLSLPWTLWIILHRGLRTEPRVIPPNMHRRHGRMDRLLPCIALDGTGALYYR